MSIVNHKHKHIFIHNPKVAGTSMETQPFVGGSSHYTMMDYYMEGTLLDNYFKWMFVRNPYDRLVSAWTYLNNINLTKYKQFGDFVMNLDEEFDFTITNFASKKDPFNRIHIIPQYLFASVYGELVLDYVGYYEELQFNWDVVCESIGVGEDGSTTKLFSLGQNYPNPFNPSTSIQFTIQEYEIIKLEIYNLSGRLVRILLRDVGYPAGRYEVAWDGRDEEGQLQTTGVYFYRLEAGDYKETRKMTLLK